MQAQCVSLKYCLTFGRGLYSILFFLNMPIYPMLSQISIFVMTLLSSLLTQVMSGPGLWLNGNCVETEDTKPHSHRYKIWIT